MISTGGLILLAILSLLLTDPERPARWAVVRSHALVFVVVAEILALILAPAAYAALVGWHGRAMAVLIAAAALVAALAFLFGPRAINRLALDACAKRNAPPDRD